MYCFIAFDIGLFSCLFEQGLQLGVIDFDGLYPGLLLNNGLPPLLLSGMRLIQTGNSVYELPFPEILGFYVMLQILKYLNGVLGGGNSL